MEDPKAQLTMRGSTGFLRVVIVLIGMGALALMLWEPHIEGRNAHATVFEIYFKDPFLAYAYVASIPFFVALHQGFRVLGYVGQNRVFSQAAVRALRTMKFCALAIIGFVAVSVAFLPGQHDDIRGMDPAGTILFEDSGDRPAGIFMRVLIAFPSIVVAVAAATCERVLQSAVEMKSENDLTV